MRRLQEVLTGPVQSFPHKIAVELPGAESLTYLELDQRSNHICKLLEKHGVRPGDRIGLCSKKSPDAVAAIFGILKAGAAYVPTDPSSPSSRNAYIFQDCNVHLILLEKDRLDALRFDGKEQPPTILEQATESLFLAKGPEQKGSADPSPDLSYILYTSGSTGNPKGVMYPHAGALAFVDWCSATFQPNESDVFSSHAPFHFDLSILDLFVCIKHGGTLILIGEEEGKQPLTLAPLISEKKITIWYSTPSILTLLVRYGRMQEQQYPRLRMVLFAGEVFPVKHLRELKAIWPTPRYFNLYGPTETNVCTYFEIPENIPPDQAAAFPIGVSCSHVTCRMFEEDGTPTPADHEGELWVTGPIMAGYWNLQERTSRAFFQDSAGNRWYKTGDIVRELPDGNFSYIGRKDRMIKRRGYRVELGEIESAFYKHPAITEAAAIALQDAEGGVLIKTFLSVSDETFASIIRMKQYAAEALPSYMIPDRIVFLRSFPKTSTDKTDYQKLKTL